MFTRIFSLILSVTTVFRFTLVGQISVSELLVAFTSPVVIGRRFQALALPFARSIMILGVLWLFSQMFSDFINGAPPDRFFRGWANIIMIVGAFAFYFCLFIDDSRRLLWFLAGLVPAGLYQAFVVQEEAAPMGISEHTEFWDLWVAPWAGPMMVLVSALLWKRSHKLTVVAMMVYGFFAIVGGARSHGLVFILAGAIAFYTSWAGRSRFRISPAVLFRAAFVVIPITGILFVAYVTLGLQGTLGEKTEYELRAVQQPYNPVSVIMKSRGELYVSIIAIRDKPLLGHGSWAPAGKYEAMATEPGKRLKSNIIPTHSTVFGAWVFGGVLGAVFWVWVFVVICRMVYRAPTFAADIYVPILCFLVTASLWNFLFSPFSFARFQWPMLMAGCLARLYQLSRSHVPAFNQNQDIQQQAI